MNILNCAVVIGALSLAATPSVACDLTKVFTGELTLASTRNQLPGEDDYVTYLVRSNAGDNAVRGEIVPSRTGFEVKNAAARLSGLGGDGTVDDFTEDASCKGVRITYKVEKGAVVFRNAGKPLGRITGRLPKGLF